MGIFFDQRLRLEFPPDDLGVVRCGTLVIVTDGIGVNIGVNPGFAETFQHIGTPEKLGAYL